MARDEIEEPYFINTSVEFKTLSKWRMAYFVSISLSLEAFPLQLPVQFYSSPLSPGRTSNPFYGNNLEWAKMILIYARKPFRFVWCGNKHLRAVMQNNLSSTKHRNIQISCNLLAKCDNMCFPCYDRTTIDKVEFSFFCHTGRRNYLST